MTEQVTEHAGLQAQQISGLDPNAAGLILNNGMALQFKYDSTCNTTVGSTTNTCGYILLDYNGLSGSNKWGQDIFGFYIFPNNIWPFGWNGDTLYSQYSCSTDGKGCAYPYIYDLPTIFSNLGGTCGPDFTLGQSCTDANGVSAFYAGTCSQDTSATNNSACSVSGGTNCLIDNVWQQYYLNSPQNGTNNWSSSSVSQYDPACNGTTKIYSGGSQSVCNSMIGASWNASSNDCSFYQANGATSFEGLAYCASIGSGWQLPSEDELSAMVSNNSSYISSGNGFINNRYESSTFCNNIYGGCYWGINFPSTTQAQQGWSKNAEVRCVKTSS